jgi:NAD(P)H dehydrogenase (quinone)
MESENIEPKARKILVFLGNTTNDSFCAKIADTYEITAREKGFEVDRVNIGNLIFDPVLHRGYKEIQQLEPDLRMMQDKILWADHIVFIYPNWWCSMPALMKGMFDRMWLPGFAFNFDKETKKLIQRLTGKTARVIIIAGTHSPFMTWWKFGDYTNEITHGILGFAGIQTKVTALGPSDRVKPEVLDLWVEKVRRLSEKGI